MKDVNVKEKKSRARREQGRRFRRRAEVLPAVTESWRPSLWERLFQRVLGEEWEERVVSLRPLSRREKLTAALALCAVFGVCACMSLASLSFGCYPVGLAVLCAVGGDRSRSFGLGHSAFCAAAVGGVLCGCVGIASYPFLHFAVYAAVFLVRMAITGGRLNEDVVARLAMATFGAALCGLVRAVLEGFGLPAVFMLVSATVLAPIVTYVLSGLYVTGERDGDPTHFECAVLALAALCLYTLRGLSVWGLSLAFLAALLFTFAVSRQRGSIYGAVAGLALGLFCQGSTGGALLGLTGFFAGLFFPSGTWMALMISFTVSAGYGVFAGAFSLFGALAQEYLMAMGAFWLWERLGFTGAPRARGLSALQVEGPGSPAKGAVERWRRLSDAFCSLSQVFYTVGQAHRTPDPREVQELVAQCRTAECGACRLDGVCWGKEPGVVERTQQRMVQTLLAQGSVAEGDLEEGFQKQCVRCGPLVSRVNQSFGRLCADCFRENRAQILAGQYQTVSKLLRTTAGEMADQWQNCEDLAERAGRVLKRLGLGYLRVQVYGRREMTLDVYGLSPAGVRVSAQTLREAFEREFSCRLEEPCFLRLEKLSVMRLRKKRRIVLECAKACRAKNGESVSGDTAGIFESDSDRFYSMICDGMGSGRQAAVTSRLAQIFLEQMLGCSSPRGLTLEMLNGFLLAENSESFTTVDLLEVDLLSGEGSFLKAGAVPSYVLRGDNLFCISSRTPPAGILPQARAQQTRVDLRPGDLVVMCSDGVCPDESARVRLCQQLTHAPVREPAALAAQLLQQASHQGNADDMTVFVLLVKEAA